MASAAAQILQKSFLAARKDLDSTNESIKKLTGFEPNVKPTPRSNVNSFEGRRRLSSLDSRPERRQSSNMRAWAESDQDSRKRERPVESRQRLIARLGSTGDLELSESKRRDSFGARSRLAGRLGPPVHTEERSRNREHELDSEGEEPGEILGVGERKPVQSSVVVLPSQSRPTADPKQDEKSKKRNQRMFGFLQSTLRKFKNSEATAKTTEKERRRSEIEDKVAKTEEIKKEEAESERRELFNQQRTQRSKVATIARQMDMVNSYTEWNEHDKKLQGYIETKAKPLIFYLPKQHTPQTEELMTKTREKIEEKINKRLKEIESFIETANSLTADVSESVGVVGGEPMGGNGEEPEANNGEMSEVKVEQ